MNVSGKKVLVFGDSLTHRGSRSSSDARNVTEGSDRTSSSPGDLLASLLLEAGAASSRINGRVSRSAYNLFTVEDGETVLRDEANRAPDVVFVFLGTNDLGLTASADKAGFIKIRDAFAAGTKFVAIGPPSFASSSAMSKAKTVYKTLRSVFGSENVIDLRPLTADLTDEGRAGDGVHFTSSGAKLTAKRLAAAIAELGGSGEVALTRWKRPVGFAFGLAGGFVLLAWIIRRRNRLRR